MISSFYIWSKIFEAYFLDNFFSLLNLLFWTGEAWLVEEETSPILKKLVTWA